MIGHLTKIVTRGNTNRSFPANDPEYSIVMKWAKSPTFYRKFMRAARSFSKTIADIKPLRDQELICYRGRKDDGNIHGWEQMGPPCPKKTLEGRYNPPHKPVLYLSDSIDGVCFEKEFKGCRYFLQKYNVDSNKLRIVDFSDDQLPNLVQIVFDFAESCGTNRRASLPGYAYSNMIASIVQKHGIDAMIVPGVKGTQDQWYNNIVVFNPNHRWVTMSLRADGFSFHK